MSRSRLTILFILLAAFCAAAAGVTGDMLRRALSDLDRELEHREEYDRRRISRIDSLKAIPASTPEEKMERLIAIGRIYRSFQNDSAIAYYSDGIRLAEEVGDSVWKTRFRVRLATCLPLAGLDEEALTTFRLIDKKALPDSMLADYYYAARQMFSYIAESFEKYPRTHQFWIERIRENRDSLIARLDTADIRSRFFIAERLMDEGHTTEAKKIYKQLLENQPQGNLGYSRICNRLANIARVEEDETAHCYYLALAARSDVIAGILEAKSLQELGLQLFEEGDVNRAYDYITTALSQAVTCDAEIRIKQSSVALPFILEAHTRKQQQSRRVVNWLFGCTGLILIALAASLVFVRLQMKKRMRLQKRLAEANNVKDIYISQFFRLCSIYIDRLNSFCQLASRKISAGQVDELYKMTKSGRLIDEQRDEFNRLFDNAFLDIFPDFVGKVNSLLREKIELREGELLNNDLRMLAFMRLGLEDTNQVALILGYSVNTIYAYRNKLRNRAFHRDTFEADVMKIGTI